MHQGRSDGTALTRHAASLQGRLASGPQPDSASVLAVNASHVHKTFQDTALFFKRITLDKIFTLYTCEDTTRHAMFSTGSFLRRSHMGNGYPEPLDMITGY